MYREMNVCEFVKATASSSPTPGGGAVAALVGALGVSLSQMVANLTLGKDNYKDVQDEMKSICADAEDIKKQLLVLVDKDTEAFDKFMETLKLPKDTDEQEEYRTSAMQESLKKAADIPLQIARVAYKIMDIAEIALEKGNKNAMTDAVISAIMSRSAVLSAVINVRINLKSIKDDKFVDEYEKECAELEKSIQERENKILNNLIL